MALDKNGIEIPTFEQASAELNARAKAMAPRVVTDAKGAQLPVDNQLDLNNAIMSDEYSVNPEEVFNVKKYDGTIGQVSGKHIKRVLQSGDYILESKEETLLREDEAKYGDKNIQAGILGAARGLSFGLSDVALSKSGAYTGDELRGIENANPVSSIGGEVVGTVAPAILSGGTSLAAKGAAKVGAGVLASEQLGAAAAKSIASRVAEKQAVRAAALEAGEKLAASEAATVINVAEAATSAAQAGASMVADDVAVKSANLFAKSLEKAGYASGAAKSIAKNMLYGGLEHMAPDAANLAIQGAMQGAGRLVTEDVFGTAEFNAENLIAYAGVGSLVGGTFGAALGAGKALVPTFKKGAAAIGGAAAKVGDSLLSKEAAVLNMVDLTPAALAKATQKRPNFTQLLSQEIENIVNKANPKTYKELDEAILSTHSSTGKAIDDVYKKTDDVFKSVVSTEDTVLSSAARTPESITASIRRFADDHLGKLGAGTTEAEKKALFAISDDFVTQATKQLTEEGATASALQKLAKDLQGRVYGSGKFLANETENSVRLMRRALLDGVRAEQGKMVYEASKIQGASALEGSLFDQLKSLNTRYSVLNDVVHNSRKSLAKEQIGAGIGDLVNTKEVLVGILDPTSGLALRAARGVFDSYAVQKRLIMGTFDNAIRSSKIAAAKGLTAMTKGTSALAKAAEPSIVRSLVSSQLAVKTVDGKKQKPKNEEEAYNNLMENANKAVVDPESVLQHSNRQTAAMFEHAPNTAAAVDAKYLQVMQFLASKTKKSSKNAGIFDIGKPYKPSGFEMAKISRYVDAISNPHTMLSKAAQGKLSREHVEVMKSIFPEMHNKLKEATLKHITENKTEMKYAQKLQLGLLLGLQAHESMQPQNIQALQSQFNSADSETSGDASYNQSAVGDMSKASGLASDTEQHEIGD